MTAWDDAAWRALAAELAAWHADGRSATMWWRDDDAGTPHPGLGRMLAVAARTATPVGVAVVPAWLTPEVAAAIGAAPASVAVLQHGWAHANHETAIAAGERRIRPAECGAARPPATILAELAAGQRRLRDAFGPRFLAILVPPWNRIAPALVPALGDAGYRGLSVFGPADGVAGAAGLRALNCHADPVLWRDGKRFAGAATTLDRLRAHLEARRTGRADAAEATGLLTHHRDMDESFWQFVETLFLRLRETSGAALPLLSSLAAP